jgi:putative NADH-flavin reductase
MKIALCGATGRAGSRILNELLARGHQVLAIIRQSGAIPPREGVTVAVDDLSSAQRTAQVVSGTEALISAYAPPPENPEELASVTRRLAEATALSGVRRLLVVGGAGSLEVSPGLTLSQSGKLPLEWQPIAAAHTHALDVLRSSSVDWTSLSPAIYFDPGDRTGLFRLGTDELIVDAKGESRISMEDYAVALVDELEDAKHIRQRFCVGY